MSIIRVVKSLQKVIFPVSLAARTLGGPILKLEFRLPSSTPNSKHKKTYRNLVILAQELQDESALICC